MAGPRRPTTPRPRLPRPARVRPVVTRGPRVLQATLVRAQAVRPFPPEPAWWPHMGSTEEWAFYWALWKPLGLQPQDTINPEAHGRDFSYQRPQLGGRVQFGGVVLDFVLYTALVAVNVQGAYWHVQRGMNVFMHDLMVKQAVEAHGWRFVFVDGRDCLTRPVYIAREALAGIDHSIQGANNV
ncbi:MAG TPA: hypothetical protein VE953_22465 [Terriglobales bacterium]|nr:hypothetical protein [Terriglobales bacterium]